MLPEPHFPARPERFIGRHRQVQAFEEALRYSARTKRMVSVAVLGEWGIGKSSLLLKLASICARPEHSILPVSLSVGKDLTDYRRLAESMLDKFTETLASSESIIERVRAEAKSWKVKQISVGGVHLDRGASLFLSSGNSLLRHELADAWRRLLVPAGLKGSIFFLDDLHSLPAAADAALALRDQFQAFGVEGLNYSVCFSAKADYFSDIRTFAEPAVRFYDKLYIAPFTSEEITEYVQIVFGLEHAIAQELADWLFQKTLGHPFFLAFISRQLLTSARPFVSASAARQWPEILNQLEQEKFSSDLGQVSERELELLKSIANSPETEVIAADLINRSYYMYFQRLTEKGLLVRTARGKYKLYHPLFKLFLQGLKK